MSSNLTSPTSADGALPEPDELLRCLGAWPFLRVARHGLRAVLYGGVRDRALGEVDLRTGALTMAVSPEELAPLLERHPRLRRIGGGVRLDITDAASCRAAEALVRWRIELERFGTQLRESSP